jgi:hypothetical protein
MVDKLIPRYSTRCAAVEDRADHPTGVMFGHPLCAIVWESGVMPPDPVVDAKERQ